MNNKKIFTWDKLRLAWALLPMTMLTFCGCDTEDTPTVQTHNPAAYIKNADKLAMLRSMNDKDGMGRLYEIDYTADYKLDAVLQSGCTETTQLFRYIAYLLYDSIPSNQAKVSLGEGCSAFAVPEAVNGNFLMGRTTTTVTLLPRAIRTSLPFLCTPHQKTASVPSRWSTG